MGSFARWGKRMSLLRLAVEKQRWDLVAHTIVLATAMMLSKGGRPDDAKSRRRKYLKGPSKR
jgi:hypothetical protein